MLMLMSWVQVTYVVNGVVIYCIRCLLYDHVYVTAASDIYCQCCDIGQLYDRVYVKGVSK